VLQKYLDVSNEPISVSDCSFKWKVNFHSLTAYSSEELQIRWEKRARILVIFFLEKY
jgi:hypothetical protein